MFVSCFWFVRKTAAEAVRGILNFFSGFPADLPMKIRQRLQAARLAASRARKRKQSAATFFLLRLFRSRGVSAFELFHAHKHDANQLACGSVDERKQLCAHFRKGRKAAQVDYLLLRYNFFVEYAELYFGVFAGLKEFGNGLRHSRCIASASFSCETVHAMRKCPCPS